MALQNIGASNSDDAFYRYKMPKMITKIEGRGNGIKTNIVNMVDIAKALARPASYTTKYFGYELGAQSNFNEKTGTSLVNGAHETAKLAGLLENFIKKYVQCYGCGNPETEIVITKAQMITLKCAACGYVSDVDMRDKLTGFIVKNPPEQKKGSKDKKAMRRAEKERLKEGEAADEELKKLKKEAAKKSSKAASTKKKPVISDEDRPSPNGSQADENEADKHDGDDDVQWQTDTSVEAARQRMQEQLSAATAEMVMLATDELKEKPKQSTNKVVTKSAEFEPKNNPSQVENGSKVDTFEVLLQATKDYLKKGPTMSQLQTFLGSQSASPQEVMNVLFEALFEGVGKGFANEVAKKKKYLKVVMDDENAQIYLLHKIEAFCNKSGAGATKEVALAVKALYDDDVLEEEHIVRWYEEGVASKDGKNSPVWKNMKPFIEWLQSAESESE